MICKCIGCRIGQPCVVEKIIEKQRSAFEIKNRSFGLKCGQCGNPRANGSAQFCRPCYTKVSRLNPKPKPTCQRCGKEKSNKGGLCQECYSNSLKQARYQEAAILRAPTLTLVSRVSVVAPTPLPTPRPYESVMVGPPPAARPVKARWNVNHLFFDDPSPGKMALRDMV